MLTISQKSRSNPVIGVLLPKHFGACGAIFFNFSAPAAPFFSFFGASGGVIFVTIPTVLGTVSLLGPWVGLGWAELSWVQLNLPHLNKLCSLQPIPLPHFFREYSGTSSLFCAHLFAVAAQQRLRRCISLGGACGATIFHQRRLRRRHFFTGGAYGATIFSPAAPAAPFFGFFSFFFCWSAASYESRP